MNKWKVKAFKKLLEPSFNSRLWKILQLKDWKTRAEALGALSEVVMCLLS